MIKKLKYILNLYTDKELEDMDLWVNSDDFVDTILIDKNNINLVTADSEIRINGLIDKEGADK